MKSKKISFNKILVLFCIVAVSVLMTGCDEPIVNIFFASPSTINQGESSTLTWSVSDADTVTITPGVGTVASSGITSVSPGVTTDYILTATNSAGSVTATATVNVGQALPPVHNLTKNTYYNTIQAALDDADSDNTIEVADGTYDETIDFPSGKKVILQSVNGPSSTTIRGDISSFTVTLGNSLPGTTIEGFTIIHAVGLSGSGIFNGVGNLTIYNCTVSNNTAHAYAYGGGIHNSGTLTITGASTVSGNTADQGGGIENSGTLTITGASTVSGNTADQGGGIFNWATGTLTIEGESTVSGNTADQGGGIYNWGTLTITGASTVSGNTAYYGGGIYNWGTLTITGASTVSGNTADYIGGGIYDSGTLTITGASTVSGNTADYIGGGIYIIYNLSLTITASTISDNSAYSNGGGIYINVSSFILTIGGSSSAEKNTICGNYKTGEDPSLDQQIRDSSGNLYSTYKNTNFISTNCPF